MEIYWEPEDYTPASGEVIFGITGADPEQVVEVQMWTGENRNIRGIKRFSGDSEYRVNVGAYVRGAIGAEPLYAASSGVHPLAERTVAAGITVGNLHTAPVVLSGGRKKLAAMRPLSDAPQTGVLAADEWVEIAWIAPECEAVAQVRLLGAGGEVWEMESNAVVCGDEMYALVVNARDVTARAKEQGGAEEDYRTMEIRMVFDGEEGFVRRYRLVKPSAGSVRLCWVNEYGAVDYHTFAVCAAERRTAEKERMYGGEGYRVMAVEGSVELDVVSEYEPRDTMRWLAGLAEASQVWMVNAGYGKGLFGDEETRFVPVDVATGRVEVAKADELSRLEMTIRPAKKIQP